MGSCCPHSSCSISSLKIRLDHFVVFPASLSAAEDIWVYINKHITQCHNWAIHKSNPQNFVIFKNSSPPQQISSASDCNSGIPKFRIPGIPLFFKCRNSASFETKISEFRKWNNESSKIVSHFWFCIYCRPMCLQGSWKSMEALVSYSALSAWRNQLSHRGRWMRPSWSTN